MRGSIAGTGKTARRPTFTLLAALCATALSLALGAAPALASDGHAFSTSFNGGTEHELAAPQGVAINQSTGNVYVVNRPANEVQTLAVKATGGTFTVTFEGQTTATLPYNATSSELTVALRNLSKIGSGNVKATGGPGGTRATGTANLTAGSVELTGLSTSTGSFAAGEELIAAGIPTGTTILGVSGETLTLSRAATETAAAGLTALTPYTVTFSGSLAAKRLPQLTASASALTPGDSTATTAIATVGGPGNEVEEFSEAGDFIKSFGTKGTGNGQFEGPTEIAIANSGPNQGDVYVIDGGVINGETGSQGANRVEIFSETGTYLSQVKKEEFQEVDLKEFDYEGPRWLQNLALDSAGNLWVFGDFVMFELPVGEPLKGVFKSNSAVRSGFVITPGPEFRWSNGSGVSDVGLSGETIPGGFGFGESPQATGVAADLKSGHEGFYLDRGTVVAHFPAPTSGSRGPNDTFGSTGASALEKGAGTAVNEANGKVYVADSSKNRVDVFTATTLPTAALEAATGIVQTGATLHGRVNPVGLEVSACQFEYWRNGHPTEKNTANCSPAPGSGSSPVSVSAAVSGLAPKTEYIYRLATTNANGTATASEQILAFKTLAPLLSLTVTKAGTGEGTVESLAPHTGIDCGSFCSAEFEEGTEVELKGEAAAGSEFAGWSGAGCSGTGICKVKMSAAEAVTANFAKEGEAKYPLTIDIEGTGSGTVECDAGSGRGPCATEYTKGGHVKLFAEAAGGSGFLEWTHGCSGSGACEVTMSEPREVGAVFLLQAAPLIKAGSTKATEVAKTTATLHAEIDPQGLAATYRFQYIARQKYEEDGKAFGAGTQETTSGSLPAGFAYQAVSKAISGLTPGTSYRFRVIAENSKGEVKGETAGFESLPYASIDALYASEMSATAATLTTQVNPLGEDAHARFEYLSQAEYEANGESFSGPDPATKVPVPDADLGAGSKDVSLGQTLTSLATHTTYRYRVLVTDSLSESILHGPYASAADSFTTQTPGPLALLDERGWELVSPPHKQGALIYPLGGSPASYGGDIQAAADGSAISYVTNAPTEPLPEGYANGFQVLSRRYPTGWTSHGIATPHAEPTRVSVSQGEEYRLFSTDLARALLQPIGPFTPSLSPEATEQGPYLRNDFASSGEICLESCYRPLVTTAEGFADVPAGTEFGQPCPRVNETSAFFCGPLVESASPDLRHVALAPGKDPLLAGAPDAGLYEWSAEAAPAQALELVSVLPAGEAASGTLASVGDFDYRNAISADGSRVFWTHEKQHLYVRDTESEQTAQLDRVVSGGGAGLLSPVFQAASLDGSRAFFTDEQRLTESSAAGDLYEWRADGTAGCGEAEGCLTDLTPPIGGEAAAVQSSAIGASEDGEYVYFVANGVLSEEPNPRGETASPGDCHGSLSTAGDACNLYLHHDGVTSFVAALSGSDQADWGSAGGLKPLTARVSPNGRWLAFTSQRSLTGYDNHDVKSGEPDQEAFLYQAPEGSEEGTLVCASCNPTGARPLGVAGGAIVGNDGAHDGHLAAALPSWNSTSKAGVSQALYQSRFLSNSGRLFFDSSDALVPHDTNGTWDAYEYEPPRGEGEPGSDTCTESSPTYASASEGCIDLVSSGTSARESAFLDASENGDDVFFLTASQLTPRDEDTAYDVYDARVGGGEAEEVKPVECIGDACQQPVSPPEDPTPGSLSYSGPEEGLKNAESSPPPSLRCSKGMVRRHGRCAKKHKAKHRKRAGGRAARKQGGGK